MSAWYKVTISGSSPDSLLAQAGFEPSVPRKIPGTSPCWFSFALRLTGNQAASWHAVLMVRIHSPPAVRCYGAGGEDGNFVAYINRWSAAMPQPNDLSRSLLGPGPR